MKISHTDENLQSELSILVGKGLKVDIDRLERDEPFADVIPNFDSLVMLEILLLIEDKEGFRFDQHLDAGQSASSADALAAYRSFPPNISALAQALSRARHVEKLKQEVELDAPASAAAQASLSSDARNDVGNDARRSAS